MNYIAELQRRWQDRRHPITPLSEEDWAPIAAALRELPTPRRRRDFRLDPAAFAPRPIFWRRLTPAPLIAVIALVAVISLSGPLAGLLPGSSGAAPVFGPAQDMSIGSPAAGGAQSLNGSMTEPGVPTNASAPNFSSYCPSPRLASPSSGAIASASPWPSAMVAPTPTPTPTPTPSLVSTNPGAVFSTPSCQP
jgi:hypothetical protein